MKKFFTAAALVLSLSLVGCATTVPFAATSNPVGSKTGEAKRSYLFGFLQLSGDGGIYTAAKNGGITKISTVDIKVTPMLFLTDISTVVTGE